MKTFLRSQHMLNYIHKGKAILPCHRGDGGSTEKDGGYKHLHLGGFHYLLSSDKTVTHYKMTGLSI
jgi:hypothetical protein